MARRSAWLWIPLTLVLLALAFLLATWALNRVLFGGATGVRAGSVLRVQLAGPLAERSTRLWGRRTIGPLTVREVDRAIRRAARDERIVGLQLRVGPGVAGLAKVQELRRAVRAFRSSGKPTVARLEIGTTADYYLAAAAERVVQIPHGNLLLGLVSRTHYYRDLLDKLGVRFEVFHTGPYKSAMTPYTARAMDPRERAAREQLLEEIWHRIVSDVAADRGLDAAAVESAFDRGLVDAEEAVAAGLVDEAAFDDRVGALLGSERTVDVRDYWAATGSGLAAVWRRPLIGLVHVDGTILPGAGPDGLFGPGVAGADTIAGALDRAARDRDVRAIVVRVDSPGGGVSAAEVIWQGIRRARERKPVIVSMSDTAASGGYWIATAATRVLADEATLTGSIGVIAARVDLEGAYAKLGIGNEVVKRGRNADILLDARPLTEEQRRILAAQVERHYSAFLRKVAEARKLPLERVEQLAAGRVWSGEQAVAQGLVDEIGGLHEAFDRAAEAAGVSVEGYGVRAYPRPRGLFDRIAGLLGQARARAQLGRTWLADPPGGGALARARRALLARLQDSGPIWALSLEPSPAPAR